MTGTARREPGRRFSHHRPRSRPGALEPRGAQGGPAAGLASFTQAVRGHEKVPVWPGAVACRRSGRCLPGSRNRRRTGPRSAAGHARGTMPRRPGRRPRRCRASAGSGVRRTSAGGSPSMPMLPPASSNRGPTPRDPGRQLSTALMRQRRVRADSGTIRMLDVRPGQAGKRLLIELADHAGSRRRVRGGDACSDSGSLALSRAAGPYEAMTDSPAPPGVRQSGYGGLVTCDRAWPPGQGGGAPGC